MASEGDQLPGGDGEYLVRRYAAGVDVPQSQHGRLVCRFHLPSGDVDVPAQFDPEHRHVSCRPAAVKVRCPVATSVGRRFSKKVLQWLAWVTQLR